ncbi:UDP-N-acetylmuramoyl-tripeptide--D-alanyl-D-alanine ligase [Candidatus Profftia tarda]|uniref:UDP-N-acetylmuramoyl-tripeptide--D-alanyl-D-alanine ligase n=1 Tax=Candidatus Profftia tarda TaxID=1177216 RepID=A0A8E4EY16_9ENTR|nr:UDP-N-acetylmuramoyl-tripeptide--D-alanyl-D-alanine ligase [Candidatus Profftia tarda]CAD6508540.1 UDP-N-acetylmuramoyl-tripeptide--D-alanyl-D-alanine ligase [Candidatus Profftia tarda]
MFPISLEIIAQVVHGKLIGTDIQVRDVVIDTRKITSNCMFIALKGKRFDAHDFAVDAIQKGANTLLVSKYLPISVPQILVADTRIALCLLASWSRQQVSARIIALTGSSGKTLVKEITASILQYCGNVLHTTGNFNNNIGVSLTLLLLKPEHKFAVLELGANHIGEISYTSNLVKPESVLINNIAAAHLEGFGSLAGVAKAKGEIFDGLALNGTAIINADSNDWSNWKEKIAAQRVWRFSLNEGKEVDFFATGVRVTQEVTEFKLHTPFGTISVALLLPGYHNIANVLAASALAISVGATLENIQKGLNELKAIPGRLFPISLNKQQLILDDTYNANVGSMIAAAHVLSSKPGYRVMVVGYMEELGTEEAEYHRQVGIAFREVGVNKVLSVGGLSYIISEASGCGEHFTDKKSLVQRLKNILSEHSTITVLVKGSRGSAMEQVVHALSV